MFSKKCDGCASPRSDGHVFDCKKRRLVGRDRIEISDTIGGITSLARDLVTREPFFQEANVVHVR